MAQLTVGSVMLAAPASALAFDPGQAARPSPAPASRAAADVQPTLATHVTPRQVALGQPVRVSGHAAATAAGETVQLQTAPADHRTHWRAAGSTRIGRHGGWAVRTHLRESSIVRAVEVAVAASRAHASGAGTRLPADPAAVSRETPVAVRARMMVADSERFTVAGRDAAVAGRLLPARAGRVVAVQSHVGAGWQTIGRGRTGASGRFSVPVRPPAGATHHLRVVFAGDRLNTAVSDGAGSLTEFSPVEVSWYDDAGTTACGFHAGDGVASRTLPCGTRVQFRNGGRTVTATVDDRGPYVDGREFDLNQTTAGALGFSGVGIVDASVQ